MLSFARNTLKSKFQTVIHMKEMNMTLLPKKSNYKAKVKLTALDGDAKTFDSIKEAADFLDVTRMAIYQALNHNGKCRGCTVERV